MTSLKPLFMLVGWLHVFIGALFIGLGVPLMLQSVKPNRWYGFRTPKTLSDPEIWYAVNRVTGRDLLIGGAVLVCVALLTLSWQRRFAELPVTLLNVLALVLVSVLMVLHGMKSLGRYS
jgi:uncharacterized membrane protein